MGQLVVLSIEFVRGFKLGIRGSDESQFSIKDLQQLIERIVIK